MYPPRFDYYSAETVEEALDLLSEHEGEEVELLAGGHSLLPTMKAGLATPDALIDIGGISELSGIERNGGSTRIGALTNYADIDDDEGLWESATALAEAAHHVGDIQVRNRGTIGGNLAHSDPASDLPAAAIASGATITVRGADGEREVDADDFFLGMYSTDVGEGELVTSVSVPHVAEGAGAYVKKPSPSSGYAMVGVAAVLHTDGGAIEEASVAANGAMDHATRLPAVEDALEGEPAGADAAEGAAAHATDDVEEWQLMDDIQASGEFRAQLLEVYTRRAIESAASRL